mmetsp:Transcript_33060/g.84282  ORF Transcript_33060/g.84282 Transcript_33060/m.84282 type:complete len:223 (+) Transcript_33060:438-1106(+)
MVPRAERRRGARHARDQHRVGDVDDPPRAAAHARQEAGRRGQHVLRLGPHAAAATRAVLGDQGLRRELHALPRGRVCGQGRALPVPVALLRRDRHDLPQLQGAGREARHPDDAFAQGLRARGGRAHRSRHDDLALLDPRAPALAAGPHPRRARRPGAALDAQGHPLPQEERRQDGGEVQERLSTGPRDLKRVAVALVCRTQERLSTGRSSAQGAAVGCCRVP